MAAGLSRNAQELAERLREQMEQSVIHLDHGEVKFMASFGLVQMGAGYESLEALVAAADGAMYQAIERGKNCVFVVTPPAPEDATPGMTGFCLRLPARYRMLTSV